MNFEKRKNTDVVLKVLLDGNGKRKFQLQPNQLLPHYHSTPIFTFSHEHHHQTPISTFSCEHPHTVSISTLPMTGITIRTPLSAILPLFSTTGSTLISQQIYIFLNRWQVSLAPRMTTRNIRFKENSSHAAVFFCLFLFLFLVSL